MKYIRKYKGIAMLVIVLVGMMQVRAQDFNTHESISSQLKKGHTPGLKYAPATLKTAPAAVTDKNEGKEGVIDQIRKGALKGMRFAGGGGEAKASRSTSKAQAANVALPSDVKSGELKQAPVKAPVVPLQEGVAEPKPEAIKKAPVVPIPTQEEEKKEVPAKNNN
ncbi:hypothetical protein HB364_23575 [Pseudoflavitalea sp. X16]|uniref:hypothetical protein n=1 Tax=Paraflavitalea devenefica TaxID=2716334 RepID=UPI001423798E|nr:hypothetical protein [Paraflavitalea devenefica]NII28085.1 hypothetical protein [Paraflavitalea devenefica]